MTSELKIKHIFTTPDEAWGTGTELRPGGSKASLVITDLSSRVHEGFGGCFNELGWDALGTLDEAQRDTILAALFDPQGECRFTHGRVPMGASDYARAWYSFNETEGDYAMEHFSIERDKGCLLPYITHALQYNPVLTLFASPWSPPVWMKTPQRYNGGKLKDDAKTLSAYALYFEKFVTAYAHEGVNIRQVHIQNEVVAAAVYPTCLWSGEQLQIFIRDYLGPRFHQHHVPAEIWLGTINAPNFKKEVGQDYDDYAGFVLSDAETYHYVAGVGYQWAGKNAIARNVDCYPELRYMQTENECGTGDNSWEHAHYVFELLRHYLTAGADSYVYWNMVLAQGGESTWGWKQNSMISIDTENKTVTYNPEYYVMRHFSHFIKPGAKRVNVTGRHSANAVCYRNPQNETVIVVNNPRQAERELVFALAGRHYTVVLKPQSVNTFIISE